jgi:Chemoreceptor zinc-binding domain
MNFDDAVKAHVMWKSRLQAYVAKPDKSLDPQKVAKDDQCDLGKWLRSQGAKFATHPAFAQLVAEHAKFHQAAGDIIRRANAGEKVAKDVALGGTSEFSTASQHVVRLIMTCAKECR